MTDNKRTIDGAGLDRRTVLRGAAWSAPVIAAAVAMPLAAASDNQANITIDSGCLQVFGGSVLPGFTVRNNGTDAYSGTITIVETIDLSSIGLSAARSLLWAGIGLGSLGGILEGHDRGVTVGRWQGSGGSGWLGDGIFFKSHTKATRTITITVPLDAGARKHWGQLVQINISQLLGGSWTAVITDPSGNPPVSKSAANLPFQIIGGC
ncbi:hypothetical protein [Microbacterium sp. YY-01]|uniref:hypothetical protein n=1 Tax=Microbacterium sp. YY-01 TaxID=3421634 RepID=UPI003D18124C